MKKREEREAATNHFFNLGTDEEPIPLDYFDDVKCQVLGVMGDLISQHIDAVKTGDVDRMAIFGSDAVTHCFGFLFNPATPQADVERAYDYLIKMHTHDMINPRVSLFG